MAEHTKHPGSSGGLLAEQPERLLLAPLRRSGRTAAASTMQRSGVLQLETCSVTSRVPPAASSERA
jgi:hypothetical protein